MATHVVANHMYSYRADCEDFGYKAKRVGKSVGRPSDAGWMKVVGLGAAFNWASSWDSLEVPYGSSGKAGA